MSRSGGTYTPPASSWNPAVNGASATLADWNALLADLTAALTQSVSKDGQTVMTGNLAMGSNKITGLSAGTTAGDSARYEQVTSAVAITGGTIDGTPIGSTTKAAGAFTTLSTNTTSGTTISAKFQTNQSGAYASFLDNGGLDGYVRVGAINNDLILMSGNAVNATLNSSGNFGLGVTPSTSGSDKLFQFGTTTYMGELGNGASSGLTHLASNAYGAGSSTPKYYATGQAASYYGQGAGVHTWYNAPSGTAGNAITFTQAMTLSATGNLQVPAMYATTVTTPRNVFIDSSGNLGGISSIRASKTNITPLANADWMKQLSPVTFNYRKRDAEGNYLDEFEDELQYGLLAEDVEGIKPEFCIYVNGKLAGVHYDRMVSPLIKRVNDLEARITALESK